MKIRKCEITAERNKTNTTTRGRGDKGKKNRKTPYNQTPNAYHTAAKRNPASVWAPPLLRRSHKPLTHVMSRLPSKKEKVKKEHTHRTDKGWSKLSLSLTHTHQTPLFYSLPWNHVARPDGHVVLAIPNQHRVAVAVEFRCNGCVKGKLREGKGREGLLDIQPMSRSMRRDHHR